ncbi:MAG: PilC/PilY family type IV pilus protein [Gammaproteobacteria bacterium]|nr:PilC/PilY family type IV pilus protein [Gammaproteobacteria bacterium]MDH5803089.1 PilC/PilY family type IV pilus protein [Gammaproteobacteria bacterium]
MKRNSNSCHDSIIVAPRGFIPCVWALCCAFYMPVLSAANLNLSNDALEVVSNVEPNVVILSDDSGSMDWAVMTPEFEGMFHLGVAPYYYTHPDPGVTTTDAPAANYDQWVVPSQEYLAAQGLASPQGGVWRAWNHNYNPIYYNPDVTYRPWSGVNSAGTPYGNVSATAAPYNPYQPTQGILDLTATLSYNTDCGLTACSAIVALSTPFTVTNFYPARFYTWGDSDSDDIVDADDSHTLVEIRPSFTYTRVAFSDATGKGRSDCTDNGDGTATCTYTQEIQNFANWFSYYRKRDLSAKAALSLVIDPIESARIGFATINRANTDNLRVASMNTATASGNKRSLMDKLFDTRPSGSTPLRTKLEQAGRYFECRNNDLFGSTADSSPGSSTCPIQAAPAGSCQQNFTVLMTDGHWNGTNPGIGNIDNDVSNFSSGAFADSHSNTLADVAMRYYKTDLHTALADNVSTTTLDIDRYLGPAPFETMHQHMSTYAIGFGVQGSLSAMPTDPATAFSWPDPVSGDQEKIDDVAHAAYNGRGEYLSANNSQTLQNAFNRVFSEIQAGTGTATAVAFNTQEVEAGTLVFRASFNTKTHRGDLVAQRIFPNGTIDSNIQWSAAEQLDNKINPDQRVIITYRDTGSSTSRGMPFRWSDLDSGQQTYLNSPQPTNISAATNTFGDERLNYLRGSNSDEGPSGADGQFRERALYAGKLGDIVHSTPVFVGTPHFIGRNGGVYPTTSGETYAEFVTYYRTNRRRELTYTGANDGMLHAIDVSDGSEAFAYIPNMVVKNLSQLSNPGYAHRFYVDLTPSINDVYFMPSTGTNATDLSWNTVLVGGLGAGGKGYYALNITQPDDFSNETSAANNVLWEFTEADDGGIGNSDLGFSFSQPMIAMSNAEDGSGNKRWVVIFGNGYNSSTTAGEAYVYVLFVDGGLDGTWTLNTDYYKLATGKGIAQSATATPNGIGGLSAVDDDNNGTVDYVYAGDLQGNVYRFDLASTNAGNWNSGTEILFTAKYKSNYSFPRDIVQPITNAPAVMKHYLGGYLVIVGTGSWMTDEDATSTDIQSIYGLWDDMSVNPTITQTAVSNQLVQQYFTNHASAEHGFTVRTLSNNAVAWNNTGSAAGKVKGWYIDLDMPTAGTYSGVEYPGERAVRNIQIRGRLMFVNTVIPKNTAACSVGTGGYQLGFNPFNGGSGVNQVFDLDGDGAFNLTDNVADTAGYWNIVTGIRFDSGTPTDAAFVGNIRFTQAGQDIVALRVNNSGDPHTGRTSWRELEP